MRKENAVVYQNHIAFSTTCCVKIMGNRIMLRFLFCQGGQSGTFFQQLKAVQSTTCFNVSVAKKIMLARHCLLMLIAYFIVLR